MLNIHRGACFTPQGVFQSSIQEEDRMRQCMRLLFVVLVLVLFGITALAQTPTGSIEGIVTDQSKAVVAGATVTITSVATRQSVTVTTNDEGLFRVSSLQPGVYSIKIEQKGFATATAG